VRDSGVVIMRPDVAFPDVKEKEFWQVDIEDIPADDRITPFDDSSFESSNATLTEKSKPLNYIPEAQSSNTAKKILLIDDDKLILITLKRLLTREGYKVTTALSGKVALRRIEQDDFDLVMSDIKMPHMDGIETVKKIREYLLQNNKKPVPEIFITAYAKENIYQEALALNAAGYIEKPFDIKALQQTVRKAIGEYKDGQEDISD
jgi:CheY-like chemotaxis protein